MTTLPAAISGSAARVLLDAGPAAVILALLPLLLLVAGVILAEPGGPPIRWTRLVAATSPTTGRAQRSTSPGRPAPRPSPSGRPRPQHPAGVPAWA